MQPPGSLVSKIQPLVQSPIAAYYLWRLLASSPRRNYDIPRSWSFLFCYLGGYCHQNGSCLPVKATWLIDWYCSLVASIKVKTMKLYLVSIKSYQLDQGIDCTAFSEPQLERTLLGTKRDDNEPTRLTRTPLTHSHLFRLLNHLQIHDYNDTVTRAALTPAFPCFW